MHRHGELPRSVLEAVTRAAYETRRRKTGAVTWEERSAHDRRRYQELITAALAALPDHGYVLTPQAGGTRADGPVVLARADAEALWAAIAGTTLAPAEQLKAFTALQRALASA